MAYESRWLAENASGTLTSAVSASDTTLASADFTALPTLPSGQTTAHTPIVLINPLTKAYEIAWVIVHASGATSTTVQRAKESTTAQAWPAGTQWGCYPTRRDWLYYTSTAAQPSDMHIGGLSHFSDKGDVRMRTRAQGDMGFAFQSVEDMTRALDGTANPTAGRVPAKKSFTYTGTTDANGRVLVPFPNGGFPVRCVSAACTPVINGSGVFWVPVVDSATTTATNLGLIAKKADNTGLASTLIYLSVEATGY